MKKFLSLFGVGLVLALCLFLAFVPAESRTPVAWLDFAVALLLYVGLWGRYLALYRRTDDFAANVPALAMYWTWFRICAMLSIAIGVAGYFLHLSFGAQAALQAVSLFLFAMALAVGSTASKFFQHDDASIQTQVSDLRDLQSRAERLKVLAASLPPTHAAVAQGISAVAEDIRYLGGSASPEAKSCEADILRLLQKLESQCGASARPEDCLETLKGLRTSVSLRRNVRNA